MKIIVVSKFRNVESFCSVILLIINVTSQINFKNLILFFCLFIDLRMIRDVITKFHSQIKTKCRSIIKCEQKIFTIYDEYWSVKLNEHFIHYNICQIFNCSNFFRSYIFDKFEIKIYDHQNQIVDERSMKIKRKSVIKFINQFWRNSFDMKNWFSSSCDLCLIDFIR